MKFGKENLFFKQKDRGQAAACLFTSAELQGSKVFENYKTSKLYILKNEDVKTVVKSSIGNSLIV